MYFNTENYKKEKIITTTQRLPLLIFYLYATTIYVCVYMCVCVYIFGILTSMSIFFFFK